MHAIGNEYIKHYPNKHIKYITSDDFIREVYNTLSAGNNLIETVKDKYQSYDLLMIDDIQFLAKKDKMNEIFFNIFNHNVANGQIIVMTSDKPPQELDFFEDRMKSRFVSGLMIKIERPDLNSIKNILKEKIKEVGENFTFTDDALNYIVHRNTNDIRRLEGFLHRILFFAINNLPPSAIIDVNTIQQILDKDHDGLIKEMGFDVDPNYVILQVCKAYGVDPDLVKSKIRTKQTSQARHICMYVLRNKFNMTFSQIGSYFSGRNYTTVMEGVEKIEKSLKMDEGLKNFITLLYKKL
ncbi:hypothetical protein FACS1894166_09380 [Bacilli bacterium]|nr:hypothetical protein FACS1894166_09380 [Bacilli bacterium]